MQRQLHALPEPQPWALLLALQTPVLLVQQLQEGLMYALLELQQLPVLLVVQELLAHQLSVARVAQPVPQPLTLAWQALLHPLA